MPRKLCWIEVDEEGKAVLPGDVLYDYNSPADFAEKVLNAAADATEEVVEAVAEWLCVASERTALLCGKQPTKASPATTAEFVDLARKLLTRLASAPQDQETP